LVCPVTISSSSREKTARGGDYRDRLELSVGTPHRRAAAASLITGPGARLI
jgi:hypothetical protein